MLQWNADLSADQTPRLLPCHGAASLSHSKQLMGSSESVPACAELPSAGLGSVCCHRVSRAVPRETLSEMGPRLSLSSAHLSNIPLYAFSTCSSCPSAGQIMLVAWQLVHVEDSQTQCRLGDAACKADISLLFDLPGRDLPYRPPSRSHMHSSKLLCRCFLCANLV